MKLKELHGKISILLAVAMLISQNSITVFASSYEDYIKQSILNDFAGKDTELVASYSDAIDGDIYSAEQAKDEYFRIGFENVGAYNSSEDSKDIISTASDAFEFVSGVIPVEYTVDKPRSSSGGLLKSTKASSLPEYYSSLTEGYVTGVKNQGYYGTCWAFAYAGAAESSMIKAGHKTLSDNPDYSELGMAYFFYNRPTDPLGLTEGDVVKWAKDDFLQVGGNALYTMVFMSGWGGELPESKLPYDDAAKVLAGMSDGSYKVDSDICYRDNEAIQKNAYIIYKYSDISDKSYISDIKQAILNHGSVEASFYCDYELYSEEKNYRDCYTYYTDSAKANHEIMIVGWDDEIPKDIFPKSSDKSPSCNGGWLIKNSWGVDLYDYFWLSYDTPINDVVAVDFVPADTYENNYYYDGGICYATDEFASGESVGNIYQAKTGTKEEIKAVNLGLYTTGAEYTVEIYENSKAMSNPTDGELKYTSDAITIPYSGYMTYDLTKEVVIEPEHYFSVVVTGTGCDYEIYKDMDLESSWIKSTTTTAPGQSMYMDDGNWVDAYDDNICYRIKVFTNEYKNPCTSITARKTRYNMVKGLTRNIASLFTAYPEDNDSTFTYTSSDTSVVTVTNEGLVKAVAAGKATITYESDNGKSASVTIRVHNESSDGGSSTSKVAVDATTAVIGGVAGSWIASYIPNTNTVNGYKYLKSATGTYAVSEWVQINYNNALHWYYFDTDSNMVTGWFVDPATGKTYHLSTEAGANIGIMTTGWFFDITKNAWYYFDTSGTLQINTTTPDGYKVGEDGRYIE